MQNTQKKITRRDFMALAGGSLVSIGLPGVFVKLTDIENQVWASDLRPDGRPRLPPGQHAVKALVPMGGAAGSGDIDDWRLKISGRVKSTQTIDFRSLMGLNQVDLTCDVHCVTGWTLLDARWTGIRITDIMKAVGVKNSAQYVILEGHAGYASNIPLSEAVKENVILAYRFFGKRLTLPHGAPVRALIPDRYFYKSVKWLTGIRFSQVDEPGYYESRGYSNSADPWKEERFD